MEFTPFAKIARLNRDITITEKIDGTNAAIGIVEDESGTHVYAQSRKRLITPSDDNFGFAAWVQKNAGALIDVLGLGLHFGEWWGSGIQRGYGLPKGEKRFSLFNTKRWGGETLNIAADHIEVPAGLGVVPVLYEGPFDQLTFSDYSRMYPEEWGWSPWINSLFELQTKGSQASPGFMNPEGIVIYHHAANQMFKVTLEGDEVPKSLREAA